MVTPLDKSSPLAPYTDKTKWLGMSQTEYHQVANHIIALNKKEPEAATAFLKNVSAFDYVKLSDAHKDFMSETIFSLSKETQQSYLQVLDSSQQRNVNIFKQILNFISINFLHFSQSNFAKQTNLLDPTGECFGITGAWLVTDKFHNTLRQEVNTAVDYSEMPMVRQIAYLQRNEEVQHEHTKNFKAKKKLYNDEAKSEITQAMVKDIIANPDKDRIQFFMRAKVEDTGHTTGMRVNRLEGGAFSLTYYDPNFGEKRSGTFTNDAAGQEKAAKFIENSLDFTEQLSIKSTYQSEVSYNLSSKAELKQNFDREANPGPADCKQHADSIRQKLSSMKSEAAVKTAPKADSEEKETNQNACGPH